MKRKALFIDRDGTIIVEPVEDMQVDSLEKLEFVPGAISALRSLAALDYDMVQPSVFLLFVKFSALHFFHSLSRVIPNLWHFEENFGTAPHGNSIPQAEHKRKI